MSTSLTGDPLTDAMVPIAVNLAWSVHMMERSEVLAAFRQARNLLATHKAQSQGDAAAAMALAVLLAAMVPVDRSLRSMLAWLDGTEKAAA
ncbi:hypothetical protein [Kutzneria albida]|uniref:Uncharacterized protein n=1 Tax=Kutzneria albida DSM 43870 TaxID=1449976 RepID=W5WBJ2_9PSEU|nr:hypothetical protein [Kutzneria albida]AHH98227.1 hypothetical protein KALB_4865 [Kutzneria albida DSM 43870]